MMTSSRRLLSIIAVTIAALTAVSASPLPPLPFLQHAQPVPDITLPQAQKSLQKRGATFIENKGQWDQQVKFLLKSPGLDMWITERGVRYDLFTLTSTEKAAESDVAMFDPKTKPPAMTRTGHVVGISFEGGAFSPTARGLEQLPGAHNYFIGNDPKKWASGVRLFAEAQLENLYDGIDARFYLDEGRPRYDLIVAPGADPKQVQMKIEGSNGVSVNADGSLAIKTSMGVLQQKGLYAYQEIDGVQRQVECRFVIDSDTCVKFALGMYDRHRPLVVDPLIYSTYLGGDEDENATGIAVDNIGSAYITGTTSSVAFPMLNEYQTDQNLTDAFVAKLVYTGGGNVELVYSSYIGGNNSDNGRDIAIDENGNAYITGVTLSTDFPTINQFQIDQKIEDSFVTKLSHTVNGSVALSYSTYVGGNSQDISNGIVVDQDGDVFIIGTTSSSDYPTFNHYQTWQGFVDAFVTKLTFDSTNKVKLVYSTYLGGRDEDYGSDIDIDAYGNAYMIGTTYSTNFPVVKKYQTFQTENDVFVAKFSYSGSGNLTLAYSTHFGGREDDHGNSIVVDGEGDIYITGYTRSGNFPAVRPYQEYKDGPDAFVARLTINSGGNLDVVWSTCLGGNGDDLGRAIAIDATGNVYITGYTNSTDFPTANQYQSFQGSNDAFVAMLTFRNSILSLVYSTFLGGSTRDISTDMAIDSRGDIYVLGETSSTDFPVINQFQDYQKRSDVFVTKLALFPLDVPATPASDTRNTSAHTVIPNPAVDNLCFSFSLPRPSTVTIQISTIDGQLVSIPLHSESYEVGEHHQIILLDDLPPGVYALRMIAGKDSFVEQFVVLP